MRETSKMKKFGSLFLASTLLAGVLAGCNSDDENSSSTDGGSSSSGDVIKIGANLELSGGVASYGSSIGKGAELAIEEINAAGGINGKQIRTY